MSLYTIEEINQSNIPITAELSVELWPDSNLSDMITHYQEVLRSNLATCFLLRKESGYVGFIELSIRTDYVEGADKLPVAYIEGLFVAKSHRHNGYGTILVKKAENWAQEKGFSQICSDAELDNNPSIQFHTSSGFIEISRVVCFVKNLE